MAKVNKISSTVFGYITGLSFFALGKIMSEDDAFSSKEFNAEESELFDSMLYGAMLTNEVKSGKLAQEKAKELFSEFKETGETHTPIEFENSGDILNEFMGKK
jgi:hypothetical protein